MSGATAPGGVGRLLNAFTRSAIGSYDWRGAVVCILFACVASEREAT